MSDTRYEYAAVSEAGASSTGIVEAASEQDAYRKVVARGLTPFRIREKRVQAALFSVGRVGSSDIAGFTRELGVLLEAKIPLARGLASMAEHNEKPAMAAIARQIAVAVEAGIPLTEAMGQHRAEFGEVYLETIRAAERSGNLAGVVAHLADLLERQAETRQMLKRALTYPVIVVGVITVAVAIIFAFVVPRFAATFAAQGIQLPLITKIVQAVAASVTGYWYLYLAGTLATAFGLAVAWRSESGRLRLESILMRVPYIGAILLAESVSRFASIMAIGLNSGLGVIECIEVSGRAAGSRAFQAQTRVMADRLRGGASLGDVMTGSPYVPSFARRMIAAGKDARELGKSCEIVGRHYERNAVYLMKNINTVIEPLLTVVLAAIVLVVALAVFLPMWTMIKVR
jgi:type II secretory pathway component PulF